VSAQLGGGLLAVAVEGPTAASATNDAIPSIEAALSCPVMTAMLERDRRARHRPVG
jgi:hypothetical protein